MADGPGNYAARRFDVNATVLTGGNLEVTETITFDFQSGTFQKVWREIPSSRTDGIDIVEARMDGEAFPRGTGPGQIEVSGGNRVRVEWKFPATGPSTHTFELRYVARGVAYREGDRDVVRWRLLPAEHRYRIAESRTTIVGPAGATAPPDLESRRVDQASASQSGNGSQIVAAGVSANGWIIAEVHYPPGSIVTTPPGWQQRRVTAAALAPRWATAAAVIFVLGILIPVFVRQSYPSPEFQIGPTTTTEPPEALPAALAAVLTAKGRTSGFQSVATLLDLANRGLLVVRELPRRLGARQYVLTQIPGKHDLAEHEEEALEIAFAGVGDEVTMSKARQRLARSAGRFARAVNSDLEQRGLLDPSRKAVRDRLTAIAIVMLVAAGVGCIAAAPFIPRFEGWPFLLPLALAAAGVAAAVMAATTTSLSDAGLIQTARWRGFKRHLKELARRDDPGGAPIRPRWIVYGIALGLASEWSRYLKKHPDVAPKWFIASAYDTGGGSFAAFVGSGSAGTSGAGAAGGAAGGGGSGAG